MIKNQGQLEILGIKGRILSYQDSIKRIQVRPARLRKLQGLHPCDGSHQTHWLVVHQGDIFLLQPCDEASCLAFGETSVNYLYYNFGKENISLDIRTEEGRTAALAIDVPAEPPIPSTQTFSKRSCWAAA